jgi:hypothetical protein
MVHAQRSGPQSCLGFRSNLAYKRLPELCWEILARSPTLPCLYVSRATIEGLRPDGHLVPVHNTTRFAHTNSGQWHRDRGRHTALASTFSGKAMTKDLLIVCPLHSFRTQPLTRGSYRNALAEARTVWEPSDLGLVARH